jgi:serine/threonine-protein kinase RsbW
MTAPPRPGVRLEIRRTVAATMETLESTSLEVRRLLNELCSQTDVFAVELLLREALTNSVFHGCRLDPTRIASVAIRVRRDRLTFIVADDGPGFDWRGRLGHLAGEDDVDGRGLSIYNAYADRVSFNRTGNRVTVVRRFRCQRKDR